MPNTDKNMNRQERQGRQENRYVKRMDGFALEFLGVLGGSKVIVYGI
jgi:hypothetical protein